MTGDDADWQVVRDFDSVEMAHSKPRWEYAIVDGGDTAAIRKTPAITRDSRIYYVPVDVVEAISDREE